MRTFVNYTFGGLLAALVLTSGLAAPVQAQVSLEDFDIELRPTVSAAIVAYTNLQKARNTYDEAVKETQASYAHFSELTANAISVEDDYTNESLGPAFTMDPNIYGGEIYPNEEIETAYSTAATAGLILQENMSAKDRANDELNEAKVAYQTAIQKVKDMFVLHGQPTTMTMLEETIAKLVGN